MKYITLTKGKFAKVDDNDYKELLKYSWYAKDNKNTFYAVTTVKNKCVRMHRLIMKAPLGQMIDHKDRDGLNNQKQNLRFCTSSQNNANKLVLSSSGYMGVTRNRNKWDASIYQNGKRVYLGIFTTPEQAAKTYDAKAKEIHGEFANLNFK